MVGFLVALKPPTDTLKVQEAEELSPLALFLIFLATFGGAA
jgi:hypothetical protein